MLKVLTKRRSIHSIVLAALLVAYVFASICIFYEWISPSLDGRTDQHIAADSTTYMYFAQSIRDGANDPIIVAALATFPNTLWVPVGLAYLLTNSFSIVVANYIIFWFSIVLIERNWPVRNGLFIILLLLNPTTTISLLSVNKEIFDLLAISLFVCYLGTKRHLPLWSALLLSLINRYEVCVVMLIYLFFSSRLNPMRKRRWATIVALTAALSLLLPLLGATSLSRRFEEANGGGVIALLDALEMHYLFAISVIPKIIQNMFGELLDISNWLKYDTQDIANSYILFFNNLANATVVAILFLKKGLKIRHDLIYLIAVGAVLMSVSLVVQPRYFYFCYVLLCLQAAHPEMRHLVHLHSRYSIRTYNHLTFKI